MGDGDLGGAGGVEFWRAEAEFWRAEAQRLTAEDIVLRARVADLEGQVGALTEKVSVLTKLAFGTSSEKAAKRTPGEGEDVPAGGAPDGQVGGQAKRGRGQQRGSRGHGRRDYSHLPTREEVHDVAEGERVCPCCGAGYAPFGEETCEQIDSRHGKPWARHLYDQARARGHRHPHAVRIVARAWLHVIWRCWQDHRPYDPARHRALQTLIHEPATHAEVTAA